LKSDIRVLEGETHPDWEVVKEFDPGRETHHHFFTGESLFVRRRPAFAFLRLFEEGALPMKAGWWNMASEHGATAARLIAPFAPLWALSAMIRSDHEKSLLKWFDRVRVATLSDEDVSQLTALLSSAMTQAFEYLSQNPQEARRMVTFYAHHLESLVISSRV
jgi:hypothetical protein